MKNKISRRYSNNLNLRQRNNVLRHNLNSKKRTRRQKRPRSANPVIRSNKIVNTKKQFFKCNNCSQDKNINEERFMYNRRLYDNEIRTNGRYLTMTGHKRCSIICEKTNRVCANKATKFVDYDPLQLGMKTIFMKTPSDFKQQFLNHIYKGENNKAQALLNSFNANDLNSYFNSEMNINTKKTLQKQVIGKYDWGGYYGYSGKWKLCNCHYKEYMEKYKFFNKLKRLGTLNSRLQTFPSVLDFLGNMFMKEQYDYNSYDVQKYEIPSKNVIDKGEYVWHS